MVNKKSKIKETGRRGFLSWAIDHMNPSVTVNKPEQNSGSVGQWIDNLKTQATFWIQFKFRF